MFLHKKILSIFFFLFSSCVGLSRSVVFDSAIPWTIAHQAPLSVGFSRQEYQSGLPFLSPEDLSDPEIETISPALQTGSLPSEPPDKTKAVVVSEKSHLHG